MSHTKWSGASTTALSFNSGAARAMRISALLLMDMLRLLVAYKSLNICVHFVAADAVNPVAGHPEPSGDLTRLVTLLEQAANEADNAFCPLAASLDPGYCPGYDLRFQDTAHPFKRCLAAGLVLLLGDRLNRRCVGAALDR